MGYVRVAHIVLRGPLGPLSPTADKRLMILKMAVSSTKMAPDSEPFVCCKIHPCILQLATHCHSGRRPGSRRVKASLYAVLNECRLSGLLTPSTNIIRRLAISLRPSAHLILSKTAPFEYLVKNL